MPDSINVGIKGIGSCVPRSVLRNEELVHTNPGISAEWIVSKSKGSTRRYSSEDESLPILQSVAAIRAILDAGLEPGDVDFIINGTNCTDDILVPSVAARVQYLIGSRNVTAFDLNAACSGFTFASEVALRIIRDKHHHEGQSVSVLVMGGDTLSKVVSVTDKSSLSVLADGGGACVFGKVDDDTGMKFVYNCTDGSQGYNIHYESGFASQFRAGERPRLEEARKPVGPFTMNGPEVHQFVLGKSVEVVRKSLEGARLPLSSLEEAILVPHQMNKRSIESFKRKFRKQLGFVPKHLYSEGFYNYGNTSPASIIIALDDLRRVGYLDESTQTRQRLGKGDMIICAAYGGGLTWGAFLNRWSMDEYTGPAARSQDEQERLVSELNEKYSEWRSKLPVSK